jgi:hypothetical protein
VDVARALGGDYLYDCSFCEKNPGYYDLLGHDGPPAGLWTTNIVTGERLKRCPVMDLRTADRNTLREVTMMRTELYPLYREGHLLVAGGVIDQPARYLSFMREMDAARLKAESAFQKVLRDEEDDADTAQASREDG